MIGLDTGFFFQLEDETGAAAHVFADIHAGDEDGAVSTITLYELTKCGRQGTLPQSVVNLVVRNATDAFIVVGTDHHDVLDRAARISHGMGLAMADALIAASLELVHCSTLYTADSDFERYRGPMDIVFL